MNDFIFQKIPRPSASRSPSRLGEALRPFPYRQLGTARENNVHMVQAMYHSQRQKTFRVRSSGFVGSDVLADHPAILTAAAIAIRFGAPPTLPNLLSCAFSTFFHFYRPASRWARPQAHPLNPQKSLRNHLFGALARPNSRSEVCPDANFARSFRHRGSGHAIAMRHLRSAATAGRQAHR